MRGEETPERSTRIREACRVLWRRRVQQDSGVLDREGGQDHLVGAEGPIGRMLAAGRLASMILWGPPGTGKTTVAHRMAEILHQLECLPTANLISVTRDDLVGEFIGHTAPKTKEVLKRAMGGVLFIDEAYYLHRPENERDYGRESIEILLQVMEDRRSELVIILAGYQDEMTRFFTSNPGLRSRVAHHIDFPDYSDEELSEIADRMLAERSYRLSDDGREALVAYIELRRKQPLFANARSIRNALDRVIMRHANRQISREGLVSIADLMTIDAVDVLASRVFAEQSDLAADD